MRQARQDRFPAAPILALGAVALGAAVALRHRPRADDPEQNLASYLTDHLMGSDAALTVVTRLSRSHEGTPEGALFAQLAEEFTSERDVVRSVLAQLGSSAVSAKRVLGYTGGAVLQAVAGGERGSLALFRTLESLLIGVQGKRCLWRALTNVELEFAESADFPALEGQALDQWERIEAARQDQLAHTFGTAL